MFSTFHGPFKDYDGLDMVRFLVVIDFKNVYSGATKNWKKRIQDMNTKFFKWMVQCHKDALKFAYLHAIQWIHNEQDKHRNGPNLEIVFGDRQ